MDKDFTAKTAHRPGIFGKVREEIKRFSLRSLRASRFKKKSRLSLVN